MSNCLTTRPYPCVTRPPALSLEPGLRILPSQDLTRAPAAPPGLAETLGRDDILLFVELLVAGALAAALPLTLLLRLAARPASVPRRGKMYGARLRPFLQAHHGP